MLQCCFQVLGRERATRLALERGELNLNVFEGGAAANIFDAMDMMRRSIENFCRAMLEKHRREQEALPRTRLAIAVLKLF